MTVILKNNPEIEGQVHVKIHIETELNVSALMARRSVIGYLIDYVSDHLGGETPTLVIDGERLL